VSDYPKFDTLMTPEMAAKIIAERGYDQDKLYAIPMPRKNRGITSPPTSETQTVVVRPYLEMDGGMVGFNDPITGLYVGCCGINFWRENAREVRFQ
jgi:hypothetical protein